MAMADVVCGYLSNRDEVLVAYLYNDLDPSERALFDAHLAACERCRNELASLRGVRAQLGTWAPPAFNPIRSVSSHTSPMTGRRTWWRDVPAWAQVAAALLVLGVAAGIANLDVRYDQQGLTVRTGWSKHLAAADVAPSLSRAPSGDSVPARPMPLAKTADVPWRADLTALELQLRAECRAADEAVARSVAASPASNVNDAAILRRVRMMLDDSVRQQQTELALRIAGVIQDVRAQRSADLIRINQSLGLITSNTGDEIYKTREQVNYLMRASAK